MKIKSFILAICAFAACNDVSAFDLNTLKNINLGGVINSLISTDNVEVSDLTGTWAVSGPAVVFKSENLLQKAVGTAAEATIEMKLATNNERPRNVGRARWHCWASARFRRQRKLRNDPQKRPYNQRHSD